MANDGQIVFEVTADGKHAIASVRDITKAIQQETGKWDKSTKEATDGMSSHFSGAVKKLVAGFSAVKIGKALLDLGKDALQAASDLEEVQNVVDVTFGGNSNKIGKWAREAGEQFGLTETQAKKFSSTMGAMLKSAGITGDKIVDVSTDLAGLAADMASFYNLDFEEAFSKIRSGISGQTMPLKELGIDMSVATLNAFALSQGLDKTFDKMSQGEQVMLRYQYLMSATADAQGDFSRTSDSYANSVRKLQTNVDRLKTTLGKGFIDTVTEATAFLNGFLESLMPDESKKTVLDDFAEIDKATAGKIEQIKQTAEEARLLLDELTKLDENNAASGGGIAGVEQKSGTLGAAVENLGDKTNRTAEEQALWLETCKRLVKTIPGLSSIINTETGEIKGGTQAVKDYIKALEEGQTKLALLGALEEKETALSSRFSDLPGLQLDMLVAEKRLRDQRKKIDALLLKYGKSGFNTYDENGHITYNNPGIGLTAEEKEIFAEIEAYNKLADAQKTATDAYNTQKDALEEAKQAIIEYRKTIDEMPGDVQAAAEATDKFWIDNAENLQLLVTAVADATGALDEYVQGVHEASVQAVNGVVKSLDRVDFQKYGKQIEKIGKLTEEQGKYKVGSEEWKKLDSEITKANESLVNTNNIYANLESQAQFLDSYLANLQKARSMGLSDNLLAELADGSVESAEYLDALVNDKTGKTAQEIDAKYQEIQAKKAELAKELTGQQLQVDQTYQSLAEKAKQAIADLDQAASAKVNAGNTVSGLAQGIADHISEVQTAVDGVVEQLERLNGWGVNIDFGGFGSINFTTSTGKTEGSGRMGIPLVPHDDYIARLHEGERVLTAQENQIWNALRNGGISGFDLDSLGGVMRDNIKPGGNVYLNGRIVGEVLSGQQGKQFRQLQRSGWQG